MTNGGVSKKLLGLGGVSALIKNAANKDEMICITVIGGIYLVCQTFIDWWQMREVKKDD